MSRPPQLVNWSPPEPNFLKVNFDGAVFREENSAGVGVIICDADGQIIASMAEKVPLPNSVAAVKTLYFAAELGISSIVLEGDSEIVIKALVSEDTSFADHGHLVEEAKLLSAFLIFVVSLMLKGKVTLPPIIWLDMLDMLAPSWFGWKIFPPNFLL